MRIVPSSMQAWLLAKENGLEFYEDSAHCPSVIRRRGGRCRPGYSSNSRAMIKGGGGALFKEKIILSSANRVFILQLTRTSLFRDLKRSVPVEVSQFALSAADKQLRAIAQGVEPALRRLDKGYPFFTESGNVILDCLSKTPFLILTSQSNS